MSKKQGGYGGAARPPRDRWTPISQWGTNLPIKEVVWKGLDLPLDEGLALEAKYMLPLQKSQDAREGADAFAKKRKPNWKGR